MNINTDCKKAGKDWPCARCEGTISKGEIYVSYDNARLVPGHNYATHTYDQYHHECYFGDYAHGCNRDLDLGENGVTGNRDWHDYAWSLPKNFRGQLHPFELRMKLMAGESIKDLARANSNVRGKGE